MIKKLLLYFFYAAFFLALEQSFHLPGDYLLLGVIFAALYERFIFGFIMTLLFGVMVDVASYAYFGTFLFSFVSIFLFLRFLKNKMEFEAIFSRFYWVILLTLMNSFISWGWLSFVGSLKYSFWLYARTLYVDVIVNAALSFFWFYLLKIYTRLSMEHLVEIEDRF